MEGKLVSRQTERPVNPEGNSDFVLDIDEEKKRSKPNGFFKDLKANSAEFCLSTSLHGLHYVGDKQRHVVERIFWLTSFLLSSCVAAYFIYTIWDKWNTTPVLVTINEVPTPVWNIPFPAVTICPQVKVKKTEYSYSTMSEKDNLTAEEQDKLQFAKLICDVDWINPYVGNDTFDSRAVDFIEQVAPKLDDIIEICVWRLNETSCTNLFTSVLTDDGLCYTFNTLSSKDMFNTDTIQHNSKHLKHSETLTWNLEGGYPDSDMIDTFPRRALTSGTFGGLTLYIGMEDEIIDPLCNYAIHGVKVLLHNPADFPNVQNQYFMVPLDRHVIVGIRPRLMVTREGLRRYPPEKRQCYFATERHLRHFNIYTQQNCEMECYTNYTLEKCGCVTYYMPSDQNTSICGPGKLDCLRTATGNTAFYIHGDTNVYKTGGNGVFWNTVQCQWASVNFATDDNGLFKCNCMPACTEISYDVETSQAKFSWLDTLKAAGFNYTTVEKGKITIVSFYYKDSQFETSRRGELFGPADFLASCGGILGLYLGFSLLSVVEIMYFFTVRLFCNLRANKKKHPEP